MLFAVAATLVACEKDETTSPVNTNSSQIVVTWDVKLEISKTFSSGILLNTDTTIFGTDLTGVLTLSNDGNATYIENDNGSIDTSIFQYSVSGNTITSYNALDTITGTFSVSGNSLSIIAELTYATEKFQTETKYTKR